MTACRDLSAAIDEPMPGTAPEALTWIVIEHSGPWGPDALRSLPAGLGDHLVNAAIATRTRVLLARHPITTQRHADIHERRIWVAHTLPGATRLLTGSMDDIQELRDWNLAEMGQGRLPAFGSASSDPVHLLCTNGRRDACCARFGRPLLAALDAFDDIWECSHLGGHRFAPTMLSLPSGYLHGRLSELDARAVLAAQRRAEVHLPSLRGRSSWPPALQAAEIAVREAADIRGQDVLRLHAEDGSESSESLTASVRHDDGRRWTVQMQRRELAGSRPASCGAAPEPVGCWEAASLRPGVPQTPEHRDAHHREAAASSRS